MQGNGWYDILEAAEKATIKATKETQEETLLQNLRNLMETLHFSAE